MIPTSIDGTDITGATIDGTDVTEITVDGDTVFSAESLPVAYSNLIAWYAFDSAEYGGSNADDVTALFNSGQSGDSTAYDGTVSGATYQSSGGVTDINAGPNSGAFDFDGSNDEIELGVEQSDMTGAGTIMGWVKYDSLNGDAGTQFAVKRAGDCITSVTFGEVAIGNFGGKFFGQVYDGSNGNPIDSGVSITLDTWFHVAHSFSATDIKIYVDGVLENTVSGATPRSLPDNFSIGRLTEESNFTDGTIDDVRFYDTQLTDSQVSDIYNNTEP